ncbi:helix-turn-helix transcriptional regulator [Streptomyces sp. NPDC006733]|uniref:helix-turn-helix domain-containing protein n=1 Tax=Streptomyces sp. NPDC006733 TaxID=3155460 RepID=UPI0033F9D813
MRDDVEEFAALLHRLKDRTDRSYGSLARRLNMNASTLHRYCAGETVPQDFAPVERLAAFCGATPQERLDLHRRWLVAVQARQRGATDGAAAIVAPARDPDRAPAQDGSSAEEPADDSDPVGAAPSLAPRPGYRRRRVVVSTAAACTLFALLSSTSAPSDERSSPGSRQRAPAPSATPAADLPLTWSVDSLVWDKGCGHDYVIAKSPAQVPAPPVEPNAGAWAVALGAVHGRRTRVQIAVQGRSSTAVVLQALHVRLVSRANPAAGSAYAMDQGCGSDLTPRRFTVNLDVERPIARPNDGADGERIIPAAHFPYRVSAEDPEVLLVDTTTRTYDARWYLELDWSCQGRTGTIRIDDHGRPFRTTSITGRPHYWYGTNATGTRGWVPYDG